MRVFINRDKLPSTATVASTRGSNEIRIVFADKSELYVRSNDAYLFWFDTGSNPSHTLLAVLALLRNQVPFTVSNQ